ncbi:hypothetical protein SAMN05444359_12379 [Neolewinella agarilytica]|uniref:Uncharacterized protein n=1 Tax=Neolewinella agarilytica TaxID=478744 RepID=A0A1H9LAV5_9BACT|nr:hypothetical protein SAMN05444359_12379 [Neolewinella agarilytica]
MNTIANHLRRLKKITTQIPVKFVKKMRLATIQEGIFKGFCSSATFRGTNAIFLRRSAGAMSR